MKSGLRYLMTREVSNSPCSNAQRSGEAGGWRVEQHHWGKQIYVRQYSVSDRYRWRECTNLQQYRHRNRRGGYLIVNNFACDRTRGKNAQVNALGHIVVRVIILNLCSRAAGAIFIRDFP